MGNDWLDRQGYVQKKTECDMCYLISTSVKKHADLIVSSVVFSQKFPLATEDFEIRHNHAAKLWQLYVSKDAVDCNVNLEELEMFIDGALWGILSKETFDFLMK